MNRTAGGSSRGAELFHSSLRLVQAHVRDLGARADAHKKLRPSSPSAPERGKKESRAANAARWTRAIRKDVVSIAPNLEAEKAVLAGILCGADFDFAQLRAEDFLIHLHRRLYARFQAMHGMGEPINLLGAIEPLKLDEVETAATHALHDMMYGPFTRENVEGYVRIVRRCARVQELQKICSDLADANGDISARTQELGHALEAYKTSLCSVDSAQDELFHSPEECEHVPEPGFDIDGFLQRRGVTFVGGPSGHSKTWLMMSAAKAALKGKGTKLWDLFDVLETVHCVVYLIPEVSLSSFMSRARRMGLLPFIKQRRLLVRTVSKGPAPKLDDPRVLACVKDALVILDTVARFSEGDENSASDNARGFAADVFALLTAGARAILCAHHSPKPFAKETVITLEGVLRGTGDFGAMATTVWGIKQLSEPENIVYVQCVKARDFSHCQPFQLRGRPCIDETGDFELFSPPGICGTLADEQPAPLSNKDKQEKKNDRISMLKAWWREDPNMSAREQVERFARNGIVIKLDTVERYRKLIRRGEL